MTQIVLFHSVLGLRPGMQDAADRLRADGHEVLVPDLYGDGLTFDEYEPAIAHWQASSEVVDRRTLEAVADLPDGFVSGGFSAGGGSAVLAAMNRPVSGVLLFSGVFLPSWLGDDVRWPQGVPAQVHAMVDDPFSDGPEAFAGQRQEVEAAGGQVEIFEYPGAAHLFADPSLPAEFDAATADLMWSRVLGFLRGLEE
ncbi:dienelactone hydrolase family protein [Angustibacter peucedani]